MVKETECPMDEQAGAGEQINDSVQAGENSQPCAGERLIPDTSVSMAGFDLENPIMPASGVFGYGMEYADLYDINMLGAIVTKSVTAEPRYGNELPRIAECDSGMLNSIGLQNPGIDSVVSEELPELRKVYKGPIIVNISGFSVNEYAEVAKRIDELDYVTAIEANISCPNVSEGGSAFGADPAKAAEITAAVKKATSKPVFMKLTPNVTDIRVVAKACEDAGADGISMINNFKAMRIDVRTRRTITHEKYAGLSGPAIKPIALRMVNEVYHAVDIPIIGIGGISDVDDVIEMIMAGASAVQIGSANLADPWACQRIIEQLRHRMLELDIFSYDEIRGIV